MADWLEISKHNSLKVFLFSEILGGLARAVNVSTKDGLPTERQPAPATPPRVSKVRFPCHTSSLTHVVVK